MIGQVIGEAVQEIAKRKQMRHSVQVDFRGHEALEIIADEMTMLRAEISTMRELLALIQAKIK